MKILHLINRFDYCDGCARHVYLLARGQKRNGHDVSVITGGGDALALLAREGIPAELMPLLAHEERSIPNFICGARRIRKIIREMRPDIVHAHHFYAMNLVSLLSMRLPARTVLTVHANLPSVGRLPKYPGDRIIAVSNSTRDHILRQNSSVRSKMRVVHNGSELLHVAGTTQSMDEYRNLIQSKKDRFVVTFIGRLVEIKGIGILAEALGMLRREMPILCVVAGAGPDEAVFRRKLHDASVETLWFGAVQEIEPILQASDVLVIPSLAHEGLPMLLLEAGQTSNAVIASRTDGIAEVIEQAVTGLLTTPGSAEELAHAIRKLYRDEQLRRRLGVALSSKVKEQYGLDTMIASVDAVYASCLAG